MALNPIVFTEKVVRSFLRYQLTAYPFADDRLHSQMRELLKLDHTRQSPLLQGPFVSVSRPFRKGAAIDALVAEGILHPHMRQRIPPDISHVYGHQEEAIRAIHAGHTTLVSTGTGSGKTECFLYPVISKCLALRDQGEQPGISAVIVYPMNALAEDQLGRLRSLLAGTGIPFGMYVGKTPENRAQVSGIRLPPGSSQADYEAKLAEVSQENRGETVYPAEEVCSRQEMRTPQRRPRILLTNVKQLELLLTRQRDVELFNGARLDFLIFDEAHTFTGALGAETACLIRRLRAFCGKEANDTVCIATSATIADKDNSDAAHQFASRFFGVKKQTVVTVGEAYEQEVWTSDRVLPPEPTQPAAEILAAAVAAVEMEDSGAKVRQVFRTLAGEELGAGDWQEELYASLAANELVFQLSAVLAHPRALAELPQSLFESIKELDRTVSEHEILAWLTLSAAARRENRPLLRPVVHGFIRGISGAVASFPAEEMGPRLWLAAEDEVKEGGEQDRHAHFPVTTCTTCGQHYLLSFLKDFDFTRTAPDGGEASEEGSYWIPLTEALGGKRVVLLERLIGGSGDESEDDHRTASLHFCRRCGAAHPAPSQRCLHCGVSGETIRLDAIRQKKDNPGYLTSCLSCAANGRRLGSLYREPARPVRATNVADVHVLAQDMVHHSERPRLLVFCDNRQDAAFQAGWMKDHARRFRLRALMAEGLAEGSLSVGDLALYLDDLLEHDESLSRALVPEVWQVVRREGTGGRHQAERRKFLRIQVLREVTLSSRQAIGLEPWGRMQVEYEGLHAGLPWIQEHARRLAMPAEELCDGVALLLDYLRRKRILHDPDREIFTKYWMDGDLEVQQGYLPQTGSPTGTKLRRGVNEKPELVTQWLSQRGSTTLTQMAKKWGVKDGEIEPLLESLFFSLKTAGLLKPVVLKGARGNALPDVSGLFQVDADRLRLKAHTGIWRCRSCRRRFTRPAPSLACPSWRCSGTLEAVGDDPENYDLQLLDQGYSMLRPEEHTAMVPDTERERLENLFKGDSEAINAFVCTPTLELGVDIGQLDAVLMRNVPPLPANYWQRAGRAGRRHRMAVDLTYCRPVSHDRAYFAEPLKLLGGRVDPPAFNMRNELMVAKHVHAGVITRLHQYARDPQRSEEARRSIIHVLQTCLPDKVTAYLFEGGEIRTQPFDLSPLVALIAESATDLTADLERIFRDGWPDADADATSPLKLRQHVSEMVGCLEAVIARLHRRVRWALSQIKRLNEVRERQGSLEPEDDALFRRCDNLMKRLKGQLRRQRREAEGFDDVNTYGVLAAEGFLPGYGLDVGSVRGTAEIPFWRTGAMEFTLPRPAAIALREYVPGNLIYANGHRFVARRFHREADEERIDMPLFEVSTARQAIKEVKLGVQSAPGSGLLQAIAVCDVDLVHQSHISDDEEVRFQLGVAVYGVERDQHNGGAAYQWGPQSLHHRHGVRLRLANIGASACVAQGRMGYPVCTVCGQSVSPLSSEAQLEQFTGSHEERCGRKVQPVGFYADVVADVLSLPACADHRTAYSVLEALRVAATHVLDMHVEDLQILVIGHVDRDEVDALLWDPMPGGSGLIDQLCERFSEIAEIAKRVVEDCPAVCESSCIDCLQTFRNAFYHKHLDRKVAMERLEAWGSQLSLAHAIPAKQSVQPVSEGLPVDEAERKLHHLLLAAGFPEGVRNEQLRLDPAIGTTTPDVIYRADHHEPDEGVCIYLDGLSAHLHGNPRTAERDQRIRTWLRSIGYDVIEIAVNQLDDKPAMTRHFRRLAGYLQDSKARESISQDQSWFECALETLKTVVESALKQVRPRPQDRYVTCVPLVSLKAAAGDFGDPQYVDPDEWEWVEISGRRSPREGMFVAQVVGKSMEPAIPDGSFCLFSHPVTGSRQGRTVLVQLRDGLDPETGERYTVKRYASEKSASEDGGWRHFSVTLHPNNPDFEPIEITCEDEAEVQVIAEFLEVLVAPRV